MSMNRYTDIDLIEEIEERGYVVYADDSTIYDSNVERDLDMLYMDYMLIGGNFFDSRLREFFNRYLKKTLLVKE